MSSRLYSKNAVVLAKTEVTEGTDVVPTGAANAILCAELSINPLEGSTVDLAYIRPYLGISPNIRVEDYVTVSLTVDIAGTATPGTAPPWGPLLRACGVAETLTGTAVTGAAQAGTTTTITLAAGASATDNIYVGTTISYTTGGTNFGLPRTIIAYNGATKVATVSKAFSTAPAASSGYSISANASYLPITPTAGSPGDTVTLYYNQSGIRHKAVGCRGNVTLDLTANSRPALKFTFTGAIPATAGIADATEAGVTFSAWQTPVAVNSINTSAWVKGFQADGTAGGLQLQKFDLDFGNAIKHRMLIGSESNVLTDRQVKGNVSIEGTTVAFNDWWAQIRASTKAPLLIEHGVTAGNTVAIFLPNAQLVDPKYSDSDGIVMLDMGYLGLPLVGNDDVRIVVK